MPARQPLFKSRLPPRRPPPDPRPSIPHRYLGDASIISAPTSDRFQDLRIQIVPYHNIQRFEMSTRRSRRFFGALEPASRQAAPPPPGPILAPQPFTGEIYCTMFYIMLCYAVLCTWTRSITLCFTTLEIHQANFLRRVRHGCRSLSVYRFKYKVQCQGARRQDWDY